jgi:hypothetical protein
MQTLNARKELISDLWVDRPDAHEEVERRLDGGQVTAAEAARLHKFVEEGYCVVQLDLDDHFTESFDRDVDRMWRERPFDLAVAGKYGDLCSFRDIDAGARAVGYRIADLHSHSDRALDVYLHPQLFRMVELIFGATAVAFQSLYFEWGSEQGLHRDPMFVPTEPPSHLVASWVALEDIRPDSGPLLYAPRSHRMPWYEFEPDSVRFVAKTEAARARWIEHRDRMIDELGLEVRPLTCQKGSAFIWHSGLLHGGMRVEDPATTRRSIVTHYSTAAHYGRRTARMRARVGGRWLPVTGTTDRLLRSGGGAGLDNPLRGVRRLTPRRALTWLSVSLRGLGGAPESAAGPGAE